MSGAFASMSRMNQYAVDTTLTLPDYAGGSTPYADVEIVAKLVANRTNMVVATRTLHQRVPANGTAVGEVTRAFGTAPYFDQPFYVGFEIGGYELGLHPDLSEGQPGPGGSVAYWRVAAIGEALDHFLASGATLVSAAQDVGEGIKVARVADPFGNVIGLIENPHFAVK